MPCRVAVKDLEGTSEMAFCFLSMYSAVRGQVLFDFCLKASAWTRCSATMDFREAKRVTHDNVGELLLNSAAHFSCSGWQTFSITSQSRRMPAISKSELVMPPVGLEAERKASSPMTTPPTPWLEASTFPTKSGQPDKSSLHRVGSFVDSRRSMQQPLIAASNCLWLDNHTI